MLAWLAGASGALAHDPSAWGGLYRSRDGGRTWLLANEGRFVGSALTLSIDPGDPDDLLLGTEVGLYRSRNRGRDWDAEAPETLVGAVFSTLYGPDGEPSLASTGDGIYRLGADGLWRPVAAPLAPPARQFVPVGGSVYLLGWGGLARSDDGGVTWRSVGQGLPDAPATALLASPDGVLWAIAGGDLWTSRDGLVWSALDGGLPAGTLQALAPDRSEPGRLWAWADDRLHRSDERRAFRAFGQPYPEPGLLVRGLWVGPGDAVVMTSDRGLVRGDGATWALASENLPVHLEGGPLVVDPLDPTTLYVGFSLVPYGEVWQDAAERDRRLGRIDATDMAGALALALLLGLGSTGALARLRRYYAPAVRAPVRTRPQRSRP